MKTSKKIWACIWGFIKGILYTLSIGLVSAIIFIGVYKGIELFGVWVGFVALALILIAVGIKWSHDNYLQAIKEYHIDTLHDSVRTLLDLCDNWNFCRSKENENAVKKQSIIVKDNYFHLKREYGDDLLILAMVDAIYEGLDRYPVIPLHPKF